MNENVFTLNDTNREQVYNKVCKIVNGYKIVLYRKRNIEKGRESFTRYVNIESQSELGVNIYSNNLYFHYDENRIYVQDPIKYTIQTTSYGALSVSEIESYMRKMKVAVDTVKWLENYDWSTAPIIEFLNE